MLEEDAGVHWRTCPPPPSLLGCWRMATYSGVHWRTWPSTPQLIRMLEEGDLQWRTLEDLATPPPSLLGYWKRATYSGVHWRTWPSPPSLLGCWKRATYSGVHWRTWPSPQLIRMLEEGEFSKRKVRPIHGDLR